jgi:hypothetical protein
MSTFPMRWRARLFSHGRPATCPARPFQQPPRRDWLDGMFSRPGADAAFVSKTNECAFCIGPHTDRGRGVATGLTAPSACPLRRRGRSTHGRVSRRVDRKRRPGRRGRAGRRRGRGSGRRLGATSRRARAASGHLGLDPGQRPARSVARSTSPLRARGTSRPTQRLAPPRRSARRVRARAWRTGYPAIFVRPLMVTATTSRAPQPEARAAASAAWPSSWPVRCWPARRRQVPVEPKRPASAHLPSRRADRTPRMDSPTADRSAAAPSRWLHDPDCGDPSAWLVRLCSSCIATNSARPRPVEAVLGWKLVPVELLVYSDFV